MGIQKPHAMMLLNEVKHRPLPKTVHLIGRQTVYLTEEQALRAFHEAGVTPHPCPVVLDTMTGEAQSAGDAGYITDETFFRMLGAENVHAIDIAEREGANIILDLNLELPRQYEGVTDFIFGGSVCDNVFNPAGYIRNINRLLAPGGRYTSQEVASNNWHPYVVLPPAWYHDYFTLNGFADVKIYVFHCVPGSWNTYLLDPPVDYDTIPNFTVPKDQVAGVFNIVEKAADSTWNAVPTQDQYRPAAEWARIRANLARIKQSPRPMQRYPLPLLEHEREAVPVKYVPNYTFVGRVPWR